MKHLTDKLRLFGHQELAMEIEREVATLRAAWKKTERDWNDEVEKVRHLEEKLSKAEKLTASSSYLSSDHMFHDVSDQEQFDTPTAIPDGAQE